MSRRLPVVAPALGFSRMVKKYKSVEVQMLC